MKETVLVLSPEETEAFQKGGPAWRQVHKEIIRRVIDLAKTGVNVELRTANGSNWDYCRARDVDYWELAYNKHFD